MVYSEVSGLKCDCCGHLFTPEDADESPLYECNSCGTIFNRDSSADGCSHRCPDCGKFGSKLSDNSCPECSEGPVEEMLLYEDELGELYETLEELEESNDE